jgi:hypothetical protein
MEGTAQTANSEWKIGKQVSIFIDDIGHIQKKDGLLVSVNQTHLFIKNQHGTEEGILLARILRIEYR